MIGAYTWENVATGDDSNRCEHGNFTRDVSEVGHKLYIGSFFSSPDLFYDLQMKSFLWNSQTEL
jgi:hypothetical protein